MAIEFDFSQFKSFNKFRLEAELELLDDPLFDVMCAEFKENLKKFAIENNGYYYDKLLPMPSADSTKIIDIFVRRFNTELTRIKADWYVSKNKDGKYIYEGKSWSSYDR